MTEPEYSSNGKELIQELEDIEHKLYILSITKYRTLVKRILMSGEIKITNCLRELREVLDFLKFREELGDFDFEVVEYLGEFPSE